MSFKIDPVKLKQFEDFPLKNLSKKQKADRIKVCESIIYDICEHYIKVKKIYPTRQMLRDFLQKKKTILTLVTHYSKFVVAHFKEDLIKNNIYPRTSADSLMLRKGNKVFRSDIKEKVDRNEKGQVFFVTAIIPGFDIDSKFLESIKTFLKERKGKLILLPMKGLTKDSAWTSAEWDLISEHVYTTYHFNSELKAFDILLNPNQINPLTGLDRFGQKDFSLIVASPKQQMKSVAVSTNKPPHIMTTTGTICKNKNYNNNRIGMLALQDHVLGGLVVEINKNFFHIRQVQCMEDGTFSDLNKTYTSNKSITAPSPKIYMGDSHAGWEDPNAVKAMMNQIEYLDAKEIFIGDLFDGTSISHHHENNIKAQIDRPPHLYSLEKELHTVARYLKQFVKKFPNLKINIIRSNHDEHLDRYLTEARYTQDRVNHRIALDLAIYLLENKNPIEEWINKNYPELNKNLKWLKRVDSYKVKHIELAVHGDKGSNGRYASSINLELSYGSCVVGHHHSPQIMRGVWIVGTNTKLQLPYTQGSPSSWLHANCAIYPTGQRQMLISVEGRWKI